MTTLDHAPLTITGTTRPAIARRLVANVAKIYRAWRNRGEVHRLGLMSERELADIGLTRADLHVAWRMPFGVDPTTKLGALAEARALRALHADAEREAIERAARKVC